MNSKVLFDYIKSVLVSCGLDAVSVRDAHETNILKKTPRVSVSSLDDSLVQDVDLVSVSRTATTEKRNHKLYDRTIEFEVEVVHKTTAEAEDLALAFLVALPSRKVLDDVRISIKAEKMKRKIFAGDKLIGVKDAKAVVVVKITSPVIRTTEVQLIREIEITPKYTEVRDGENE